MRAMLVAAIGILSTSPASAAEASHMLGRQSQNEGILVVPKKGAVIVDGDLADWDLSGRIWCFADKAVRDRYSVQAAAMWDTEYLYLAAKWKDPTPAFSQIDPAFNPGDGWKSDSWQLRIQTDRRLWITTWLFTPKQQPVMHIATWKNYNNSRDGQDVLVLAAKRGGTDLGQGAQLAYRKDADARGFVQEVKIPWALIYKAAPEAKPGLTLRMGMEFLWGDVTGKTWPVHRYADNMQPGQTSREFFWTAARAWGDATLVAKGKIPLRQYVSASDVLQGTVPVRAEIPADAARFTMVIEDAQGKRVRNLAGDFDPADYTVETRGDRRVVEVKWDCLDDWGRLAKPGTYTTRGLTRGGLRASYEMTFYNPGTPPWRTKDGNGAWGADHADPLRLAASGDWMIASWGFAEGGSGIVGIGPDGLKKWGEKRGASVLAADAKHIYAIPAGWHIKEPVLCRFGKTDGSYQPFVKAGKPRPFELKLTDIFGEAVPGKVRAMAVHASTLVLAMSGSGLQVPGSGEEKRKKSADDAVRRTETRNPEPGTASCLAVLDAESATLLKLVSAPNPTAVACSRDGVLYAVLDGKLHRVDLATGKATELRTPGLGAAGSIAVDNEGNVVIADTGPDSQVKAYRPARNLLGRSKTRLAVAYTCGRKGGRPIRGAFDPQAMTHMTSVAVDSKGHIWAVEGWSYPRRISVWGRDGKLVRDYIGNTGYAGTGCYLHNQDPTLGYCGPIEMKLDKSSGIAPGGESQAGRQPHVDAGHPRPTHGTRTWKVTQVLWLPDPEKGESFPVAMGAALAQRFTSAASGTPREYLYHHPYDAQSGHVVYMKRQRGWQPVAAVCYAGHVSGRITHYSIVEEPPSGEMAGLDAYDGIFWNDRNGDGKVQRAECVVVPAKKKTDERQKRGEGPFPLRSGWGGRIGSDLVFYTDGIHRFRPMRFTAAGAPVYGPKGMEKLPLDERGDLVPVPDENLLLCLSFKGYADRTTGMLGVDARSGKVRWSYPNLYPGVHGSHRAPMPSPGLLLGPLKVAGVVHMGKPIGRVFMMRGNLGQDFFMTTDGLFVGALFQDGRLPGETLPQKEETLLKTPMEGFSNGSEPFNGWFGKQSDGKIRMTTGFAREACMILQVHGLDSVRRFRGPQVALDQATIVKADQANTARASAAAKPKTWAVKKLSGPIKLDCKPDEWRGIRPVRIEQAGSPERAQVRLGWDDANLCAFVEVTDPSPWLNEGKELTRLFKTGDALDLHLNTDPKAKRQGRNLLPSDVRIVVADFGGKPTVVLMKPIDPAAPADRKTTYQSPVGTRVFDRVEALAGAKAVVKKADGRYTVEVAIPLKAIGLTLTPGLKLRGDVGFISSDAQGRVNVARTYWANPHTSLVSDLPSEAWLYPEQWGELTFE